HQQALELFRDLGARQGEAEALNNLGQLATRTSATQQARGHHVQALAIARDLGVPLEQARALEGIGDSHLQDGNPAEAASTCGRRLRSTSASALWPRSASSKPSTTTS